MRQRKRRDSNRTAYDLFDDLSAIAEEDGEVTSGDSADTGDAPGEADNTDIDDTAEYTGECGGNE